MVSSFKESVDNILKEIQKDVYVNEDMLRKIVALFLAIRDGKYPNESLPRGLLFYGPPGTGKTLLMRVLSEKLELKKGKDRFEIGGPEIISQYYGKSEAKLRNIFREASERAKTSAKEKGWKKGLAIIYIDELDSIAARRDVMGGELEPRLVGQLLSLMDGLDKDAENEGHVIVIGSTNRPDSLDPALRRPGRFDLEFEFEPPNDEEREKILHILKNKTEKGKIKFEDGIYWEEIARKTVGFTGADLRQLLNDALLLAVIDGREKIKKKDIERAIGNVTPSALREYIFEKPENKSRNIKKIAGTNKKQIENISNLIEITEQSFVKQKGYLSVLIPYGKLNNKIASTIAYKVSQNKNLNLQKYIVVNLNEFRTKWFGETERNIRRLFNKIRYAQPSVVYLKNFDSIAYRMDKSAGEPIYGALIELLNNMDSLEERNAQILLLCGVRNDNNLDPEIKETYCKKL